MAMDIDDAFVRQYESEVHEAYQRKGSLLRNTVRVKNNITGKSTTFQKVGKGTAGTKTRHGNVPLMNADHTPVECDLADYYAADYIDRLDELKINHNEREVTVNAGAYALGRKTDELIIAALDGATTYQSSTINLSALALSDLTTQTTNLGGRDVPMERGNVFGVVSWEVWGALLQIDAFTRSEYIGNMNLPFESMLGEARFWNGVIWFPHSGLTKTGDNRTNFIFHRTSVGHAIGADVTTMMDWVPEKAAFLADNMMSQGSVLIDTIGVQQVIVDEAN